MNVAKTSVTLANIEVRVLGEYDIEAALVAFDAFPWLDQLREVERLEADGKDCISPDMTFSRLPYHFTATVGDARPTLDVELCVPMKSKLLGLFATQTTKFFGFKKVSRGKFEELLRAFYTVPVDEQFAFYSKLKSAG